MADAVLCPKWSGCSAPVCPLAPHFGLDATTLKGEAVCLWLREGMKDSGFERMPAAIATTVREALPVVLRQGGAYLRSKLNAAAKSGSKRSRFTPVTVIQ